MRSRFRGPSWGEMLFSFVLTAILIAVVLPVFT